VSVEDITQSSLAHKFLFTATEQRRRDPEHWPQAQERRSHKMIEVVPRLNSKYVGRPVVVLLVSRAKSSDVRSTRISRRVNAPRAVVYRALLDAGAVATWMVPTGMTSQVHAFDAREGGSFRISLTYHTPIGTGKTTAHTDTYRGRFVKLVPNEQVVEVVEFETTDPALRGEMTITVSLTDADGGTDVPAVHDGLPPGLPTADNEAGWRSSLAKLAALVEAG
jgi:uncharacterized protein YndB with AHSA1/START domain